MASVRKTIKKHDILAPGDAVVAGVSGGADSVCLLHVLLELAPEYRIRLIVAHLHHGIRGEEADRDLAFVEDLAGRLGLQFEAARVDVPEFKRESGLSPEDAARTLRYRFFNEILVKCGANKIATAHTEDDQAETLLMRLIRGSGTSGLSGIAPVSEDGRVVRPLIYTPKSEILRYLSARGISWVLDSTNKSREYLRNRIRLDLLPELLKFNPNIARTLSRTAEILRLEGEFIQNRASNWIGYVFRVADEYELLGSVARYKMIPDALRPAFLRIAVEKIKGDLKQISSAHILAADELLLSDAPSGEISLPSEIIAAKGYDAFSIARKSVLERRFFHRIPSPGRWIFPDAEVEVEIAAPETFDEGKYTGFFDLNTVRFPIELRSFEDGMRFHPLGMKSAKKLKRFFIDEKMPQFLRRRIPIFISEGEIFWIGGMRIDERFRAKGKGEALRIALAKPKWMPD